MKNQTTYQVLLINHDHQGRVILEIPANHEIHAARKAEKMAGVHLNWEAVEMTPVAA